MAGKSGSIRTRLGYQSLLRERLVFGLGEQGEDQNTEQEHEADGDTCRAEALKITAEALGDLADGEGRGRGDETAEIVAEARAGGAKAGREKFGQIDRVDGEHAELAEAHEWDHPEDVVEFAEAFEDQNGRGERKEEREGEGEFAALDLREFGHRGHAEEGADVLQQQRDGGPKGFLAGEFFGGNAGVFEMLGDDGGDDRGVKIADAPESDDTRAAKREAGPGVFAPARVREESAVGTELDTGDFAGGFGVDPFLRLFEFRQNEDAEKGGRGADQKHGLPSGDTAGEQVVGGEGGDAHADEGGGDVTNTGEGLKQAEGRRAGFVGDGVGDESHCETEDAAYAHAGEKPINAEIKEAGGERAQAGEHRVEQHGDGENLGPAVNVAHRAEEQAADGPADEEHRSRVGAVFGDFGFVVQELLHRGAAAEVEELLVHAVEEPRKRGDGEDEPMVARHQFIPRLRGGGGGGGHKKFYRVTGCPDWAER